MNSYSDSGYQEAGTFHNHSTGKPELRQQHSFQGTTGNHIVRSSRAEGQAFVQVRSLFKLMCKIIYVCRCSDIYSMGLCEREHTFVAYAEDRNKEVRLRKGPFKCFLTHNYSLKWHNLPNWITVQNIAFSASNPTDPQMQICTHGGSVPSPSRKL